MKAIYTFMSVETLMLARTAMHELCGLITCTMENRKTVSVLEYATNQAIL